MANSDQIVAQATADLQRAERTAEETRQKLALAEQEVDELRSFLQTWQRYANTVRGAAPREHDKNEQRSPLREGTTGRGLVDECIRAIGEAGHPLPIGSLLDWCLDHGRSVGGADQKSNLAGYLSRDPRMKSLGRSIGWTVVTQGAALEPASEEAAPSTAQGGTNDRSTLVLSGVDDASTSSTSQVPQGTIPGAEVTSVPNHAPVPKLVDGPA